jgi:mannosyl-3-phosphoglycerate phosphatase
VQAAADPVLASDAALQPTLRVLREPDSRLEGQALLFVSDLDGTLLDDRYRFDAARPALEALTAAGATLVLASSKTRAEMEPLVENLGLSCPLIVENGGAILLPSQDGGYETVAIGIEHDTLRRALVEIGLEVGVAVRGFSSFDAEAVAFLTGLDVEGARRALSREHDEPFVLSDERKAASLAAAAERRGLQVTRGGRFFHLTGDTDKGRALEQLFALIGRPRQVVGLGDARNDLPLLAVVDRPIVIPRANGEVDPALESALPRAEVAPAAGPAGWNHAVHVVLSGGRLPAISGGDAA